MKEMKQAPSYEKEGVSAPKAALRVFGCAVLAGVIAMFVFFSVNMLTNAAFTKTVGYHEYEYTDADGDRRFETKTLLETVYFDENTTYEESTKLESTDDRRIAREMITQPKNELCAALISVCDVLAQVLMIALLLWLPASFLYGEGDRDRNLEKHHGKTVDKLSGLWIGLMASAPSALVYALLVLGKNGVLANVAQQLYRFGNLTFTPLVNLIMPLEVYPATAVSAGQLVLLSLLLIPLPAVCALSYYAGYRRWLKPHKKKRA